jgi:chemotaxis protein CheX
MDVRYINPFVSAVQHVFKTMLDLGIFVSKATVRGKERPASEVSAVIGLSGPVTGTVALCFSKQVAVRVASAFTGKTLSIHEPDELVDALGELANMVAGQAKVKLPPSGISISLPQVIIGDQHREIEPAVSPILLLPCDSPLGRFSVEVTMVTSKSSPYAVAAPHEAKYARPSTGPAAPRVAQ